MLAVANKCIQGEHYKSSAKNDRNTQTIRNFLIQNMLRRRPVSGATPAIRAVDFEMQILLSNTAPEKPPLATPVSINLPK